MLDNAAYHCVYGETVPQWYRMKKQECIDYLTVQSINFDPAMSVMEMKQLIKGYITTHVVPIEIKRLAEAGGHTILLNPAYHSDLQPIELVWARVKGNVGWQYSNQSTLDLVYEWLMHEFNVLEDSEHASINGMIEKCASLAWKFYGQIEEDEEMEEQNDPVDPENASDLDQEDPPDPRDAGNNGPGDTGGDDGGEQSGIGPFTMV
jgi:hypothetical protein